MKISLPCSVCINQFLNNSADASGVVKYYNIQLQNSAVHTFQCDYGHQSKTIVGNPKYDLLFMSGISAVRDGYYRDALLSFASSIETFYQVAVCSLLYNRKLGPDDRRIDKELLPKFWGAVSKQVERQMGAFYLLYCDRFQQEPPLFTDAYFGKYKYIMGKSGKTNPVEIRNKVTHAGLIPTRDQAIVFGEAAHQYIKRIFTDLKKLDFVSVGAVEGMLERETGENILTEKDVPISTVIPSFLCNSCFQYNQPDAVPMTLFTELPLS